MLPIKPVSMPCKIGECMFEKKKKAHNWNIWTIHPIPISHPLEKTPPAKEPRRVQTYSQTIDFGHWGWSGATAATEMGYLLQQKTLPWSSPIFRSPQVTPVKSTQWEKDKRVIHRSSEVPFLGLIAVELSRTWVREGNHYLRLREVIGRVESERSRRAWSRMDVT